MTITLAKGGTKEKTVELKDIVIPDLYKIAQITELKEYSIGGKTAKQAILETWHLAHSLLERLKELEASDPHAGG